MRRCRWTWRVWPVLLLAGCGSSRGEQNDATLIEVGGGEDMVSFPSAQADLEAGGDVTTVSDVFADKAVELTTPASIADAAWASDVGGDQPSRMSCTREEMYPVPPCPGSAWYLFADTRCFLCGPSDPLCSSAGYRCVAWGDQLCYRQCKTNADCPNPCMPFCREIILYAGADQCGAVSQSVCLHQDRDACASLPSQSGN